MGINIDLTDSWRWTEIVGGCDQITAGRERNEPISTRGIGSGVGEGRGWCGRTGNGRGVDLEVIRTIGCREITVGIYGQGAGRNWQYHRGYRSAGKR